MVFHKMKREFNLQATGGIGGGWLGMAKNVTGTRCLYVQGGGVRKRQWLEALGQIAVLILRCSFS